MPYITAKPIFLSSVENFIVCVCFYKYIKYNISPSVLLHLFVAADDKSVSLDTMDLQQSSFSSIARSDISVILVQNWHRGVSESAKKKILPLGIELTTPTPLLDSQHP